MPRVLLLSLGLVGIIWFETQICTWTKSLLQAKLKWAMTKHFGVMIWFDENSGISITVWWYLFSGMYYTWYKLWTDTQPIYTHHNFFTSWNLEVPPLKHVWTLLSSLEHVCVFWRGPIYNFHQTRGCEVPLGGDTARCFLRTYRMCKQEELFLLATFSILKYIGCIPYHTV